MTQFHRDDLTGEEYVSGHNLMTFGITQEEAVMFQFETHSDVYHENPERIAEELHNCVDEWLVDAQEWLEEEYHDAE